MVQSFDIFDTLIARDVPNPTDLFAIIEKEYPFPHFKQIREQSQARSNHTINDIYKHFSILTGLPDETCEAIKEFEIQTEMKHSTLIVSNYNRVKDGDILVSDMYLRPDDIMRILKSCGFEKKITLFVTPGGKASGSIWKPIQEQFVIDLHLGDNMHSDVEHPKRFGIRTEYTDLYKINEIEHFFMKHGYSEFGMALRKFRLQNPYPIHTTEYSLYQDQIRNNIPVLILLSCHLNEILKAEKRTTLLLQTRDGCLLEQIFPMLFPDYQTIRFESSRHIYKNPTPEYIEYLKKTYQHDTCLLFDMHGAFLTGRELFLNVFGVLPRVHLFDYVSTRAPIYEGLTYTLFNMDQHKFESFNADTCGMLVSYLNGTPIRANATYPIEHAMIYKNTVKDFCKTFVSNIRLPKYDLIHTLIPLISQPTLRTES